MNVPAYLQGFETFGWPFSNTMFTKVPAYLQGLETKDKRARQTVSQEFQHTYKGSKRIDFARL